MVKLSELANSVESNAVGAVRALLERVSSIQITEVRHEQQLASDYRLDSRIDFRHAGTRYALSTAA